MNPYLEEEAEADPLVVRVALLVFRVAPRTVYARVRYDHTNLLLECRLDGVRRVDPAVSVEHVLRYILSVNAVNGVPDVLSRRHY